MATQQGFPTIAGYTLHRVIGQGGMSIVYLAEQNSLGRKVALKVMLADALADEVSRVRFENEARTIARLEHPNIVGIHDVGRSADGLPYYSMSWLSHGHLAQRKLVGEQQQVAAILRALLGALDYAHVRGVVHRDVKAENVLFDDVDRPMLADFGIAQQRGSNPRLTSERVAVGSTAYMAPEQARGKDVDRRADLYSMGVLTWEMLTGHLPYSAGDALSMAVKHAQEPIPRLPPSLKHWQPLIDRSMAKKPEDRFASANDMLAALDAIEQRAGKAFGTVEVPRGYTYVPETPEQSGGSKRTLVLAGGVLALVIAGAYFGWSRWHDGTASSTPEAGAAAAESDPAQAQTTAGSATPDPASSALDAFPGQGIGAYLANADQQLREGQLLAPANANAWDSLEAAWKINPTNPIVQHLTAQMFDALAEGAVHAVQGGDPATARSYFEHAQSLDTRRGGTGEAMVALRAKLDAALDARLTALLAKRDAASANALLAGTGWMGLPPARRSALLARIDALSATAATAGKPERRAGATPATAAGHATPAEAASVAIVNVTRAEYARFASASGRAPADCGKKLFGRRPRWDTTGSDARPVVCVSAADAQAYASWRSAQEGKRYRLPSAGELRQQPRTPVAGWVTLCADAACTLRMASGKAQPLDASRGYDDIGIRLVRAN
ncbi:bifunctional serine/threonine-protein kinase/formylglycine-generating enzyme family protein [Thermomonas sp.]|uniref:bifunctional serine/threonine-protein kinase/formylglycine-generating enzyme family protein n=1 Tax=Thermomonas sp. TaxID=1971895 RepID=UPI0026021629|nr:bifunctional serine/threonine-protein kinase/formylglycine-generating enzyme family protein [Thermomonas sp.]